MAIIKSSCVLFVLSCALVQLAEGKLEGRAVQNPEGGNLPNDAPGNFPIEDGLEVHNSSKLYTGSLERQRRRPFLKSVPCTYDDQCSNLSDCHTDMATHVTTCVEDFWCQNGWCDNNKGGAPSLVCNTLVIALVVIVSRLFQLQLQ